MTYEAPLIREECEYCDGTGGYYDQFYPEAGESKCPCCDGTGWTVVEVETDDAAGIQTLSIRSVEPVAKQQERWSDFRARLRDTGMVQS